MMTEERKGKSGQGTADSFDMETAPAAAGAPVIAETKEETDRKCPACGGVMDFNPAKGNLVCPYCGTEQEIESEKAQFTAKELDFSQAEEQASCDWGTATKTVICKSCGAETVYDVNQIAHECPYCGSNQVMEAGGEQVMAPGGVVLFKLDAKAASDRFRRWIGSKFFCPKLAKDSAKPASFKGMYIPFWTFDSRTVTQYQAQFGINHVIRGRDGKTRVQTSWHHTSGRLDYFVDDMLVCGSSRQDEEMLRSLEPYDTKNVAEYRPEYLAGFMAERYTLPMKDAWEQAKDKIAQLLQNKVREKIVRDHHADHVQGLRMSTVHNQITYKYLLLPVWISSFQYNGTVYRFMVNGQTGKVSGKTPVSWVKVAITVVAAAVALGILMYLTRI